MIVENISALCKEQGTTFAEVERVLKLGNGTIRRWNEVNPRIDRIKLVADYFGVTIDDLLNAK